MLGSYIKLLRKQHKMTQAAFASAVEVSQGYLSKVESNKVMPSIEMLLAIRYMWKTDINQLFDTYTLCKED